MSEKPSIFISYSREDHEAKDFVVSHLDILAENRGLQVWHDRDMAGGDAWRSEVDRQLRRCIFAIFLVSRHSLGSAFIRDVELPVLRDRQASQGLRLYPILIESCPWQEVHWLKETNIRPACETPLVEVKDAKRNPLMADMAKEIGELLADTSHLIGEAETEPDEVNHYRLTPVASFLECNSR